MDGPQVVRYDSAGVKPAYYNQAYALVANNGNKIYNNTDRRQNDEVDITELRLPNNGATKYYPTLEEKSTDKWFLKPTAMYFHNVDYTNLSIYINHRRGAFGNCTWRNPLLIVVDPYGNHFLNSWNGDLLIDKDNNTIMSAVMGAGRKESDDNTFTGLLLGDLPKDNIEADNRTGLLGYEHGEKTYGIFDDGTMFLGKASTAQLTFNGTDGYIQNAGYGPNGHGPLDINGNDIGVANGIRINFSGATKQAQASMGTPYIHLRKDPTSNNDSGAEIFLNTGGSGPYNSNT